MRIRSRSLYGALLLTGLTLSLVEGAWASACGPAMPDMRVEMAMEPMDSMEFMDSMESMHSMPAMASTAEMPPSHDCTHQLADDSRKGHSAPDCPFSHNGSAQGCAVTASLPAPAFVAVAFSPEGASYTIQPPAEPHLLLASTLFHPPKA
jgi:hypothetical protein